MKPQAGDILFVEGKGKVPTLIRLGQAINLDTTPYTHIAIFISETHVLEALAKGSTISPATKYPGAVWHKVKLSDTQRAHITASALDYVNIPYNWMDYFYLAIVRLGLTPHKLTAKMETNQRMICSQLADYVLTDAGYKVFTDGRRHNEVTPGDLHRWAFEINKLPM